MKKIALTIAIVLGMGIGAIAQTDGGLMGRGDMPENYNNWSSNWSTTQEWLTSGLRTGGEGLLSLPSTHGAGTDYNAPLGGGIALLLGMGGAYLVGKRKKKGAK